MIQPVLQPQQPPKRTILTVSQLNQQSKSILESELGAIWLTGEISNLTRASSGHWYFSLKDNRAQIRCAMFKFKAQSIRFTPEEGDKVIVKGKVSLYEARGDYQLITDFMEPAGLGNLQQQLNELIQKLQASGLFSSETKKQLPRLPQSIGIITSPTGAAIHDVLNVLKRRCPMVPVILYPTQVQGSQAVNDILNAIDIAESRNECDVLLITRGGGSLEDLWCFNNELLARRIGNMKIPVIAAIGHEVDVTITELVADIRAPTPSAAAELLVPEKEALQQKLDLISLSLSRLQSNKIERLQAVLNQASLKLTDPANTIEGYRHILEKIIQKINFLTTQRNFKLQNKLTTCVNQLNRLNPEVRLNNLQQKLASLKMRLENSCQKILSVKQHQLQINASALDSLSPLSTLARGYSIVKDKKTNQAMTHLDNLSNEQQIKILMNGGEADARITSINKD